MAFTGGPTKGIAGARQFYDKLTTNFRTDEEQIVHHADVLTLKASAATSATAASTPSPASDPASTSPTRQH